MKTPQLPQHLPLRQTVSLHLRKPVTVRVFQGRLWITSTGLAGDHFVHAGESLALPCGHAVLEADQGSTGAHYEVCPAAPQVQSSRAGAGKRTETRKPRLDGLSGWASSS